MPEDNIKNNICRLCLTKVDETQFTSIFPQIYNNGVSLVMKIMVCVSLTIQEGDPFPKKICRGCEESVNTYYSFRETCCQAYLMLIQNFRHSKESDVDARSSSQNLGIKLSENDSQSVITQEMDEQFDGTNKTSCEKSLDKGNSNCDLAKIKSQSHTVSVTSQEESSHRDCRSELKIDTQDSKVVEESKVKYVSETVEELSSPVNENSLTTYNVDADCYQVEEIHEQILCGKYAREKVRYKCSRCENNFDDLESVTAHYADYCQSVDYQDAEQVSVAVSNDEEKDSNYLDAFEYLDESFELQTKGTEKLEYSNNSRGSAEIDSTNNSDMSGLIKIERDNVVENDKQNNSINRDSATNYDSTSSYNSNPTTGSFVLVSKKFCDLKIKAQLQNSTSKPQLLNLGKVRKRKGRWSEKVEHPCPECDRIFSSNSLLKRHSYVHTGEKPHVCEICDRRFAQVGQLNFHRKFHNNPRYRCRICNKPFLRPSDIDKHMRTHTGEKPYDCKICLKSFAQLGALQQHSRIHSGEKPYLCEICGKRFSQKANKTKHMKIHKEGERPHTCYVCGRSFSELSEMELHRAGHGGGRPRKCDYCEDSFRKLSELNHHVRRFHTFERQHKCMFCPKEFYSIYNLKQHVMVHTGQKPYACSKCDLKFTQKGNLTKHFERKHSEFADQEDRYIVVEKKSFDDENLIYVEENLNEDEPNNV